MNMDLIIGLEEAAPEESTNINIPHKLTLMNNCLQVFPVKIPGSVQWKQEDFLNRCLLIFTEIEKFKLNLSFRLRKYELY